MYLGDLTLGVTFDFCFTTRRFTTGAPFALASGVISAYEDNSTTQITAGITLTADFDGVTGLNHVRVVFTSGNGYEAGKSYSFVITTGTVDSVSVVGEVVGYCLCQRGAAFERLGAPAGASIAADLVVIDNFVDDIESRLGTPSNLGGGATVAANLADIEAQTDDIGAAGAGLTAVPWNASWDAEVQSEVDDALVAHRLDELLNADSDIDGAAPPTVGSVFHELLTKTAGSFTYDQTTDSLEAVRDNMGTAQTGDSFARLGAPAGASIAADLVVIDNFVDGIETTLGTPAGVSLAADIAAIEAQTDDIGVAGAGLTAVSIGTGGIASTAFAAGAIDAAAIAADAIGSSELAASAVTEIQSGLATAAALDTVDNFLDTEVAAILAAVDTEVAAILALLDDARGEPGQGAPPVNPDAMTKLDYIYKSWRNKKDNDGSETKLYADDATTVDHKQATTESGGTVTKGEWATGP